MPVDRSTRAEASFRRLAVILAVACASPIAAQGTDTAQRIDSAKYAGDTLYWGQLPARWEFGIGGFLPNISTTATLSGPLGHATSINLEHRLGLSANTQTLDLLAGFRIANRHMVSLEFFSFGRSATKTLTDSLVVNDSVYHAGATVDLNAKIQYYGFTYRYYIWRRQRWELGTGLGIDALNLNFNFGVRASAGGKADSAKTGGSITAPVPLLGIYFDWEMWRNIYLRGQLQALFLSYQQYSGGVRDRRLMVEWYPWRDYGFGAGWHYVGLDIKRNGSLGGYLEAKYGIQGLSAYFTARYGAPRPVAPLPPTPITEPPPGQDFGLVPRIFSISIGGFLPSVNSNGRFSTQNQEGTGINLENILGLPKSVSSLDIEAALRIANRSLLTFTYFSFSRSGSKTVADTIHWGDSTFVPGAQLDGTGGLTYYGFSYRYYFWRTKAFQLGGGLGLDEVELHTKLGVKSMIAGKPDSLQTSGTLSTPAPMLGLYADWRVVDRVFLRGAGEWISAPIGNIHATVTDDMIAAEWYIFENYGIGGGYHYVGADVTKTLPKDASIHFNYTVQGQIVLISVVLLKFLVMRFVPQMRRGALMSLILLAVPAVRAQEADTAKKGGALSVFTDTAQRYGLLPRHFTISIGGYLPSINSNARLETPSNGGTEIPLENRLGLQKTMSSLDLQAAVRIARSQLITLGYFGFKRSGSRTLTDSIVFGDSVYRAGATIDATAKFYYYGLTYRYYFVNKKDWDLGAGLGVDAFNINAALGVRVNVVDGFVDSAQKSGGFTAPSAMLGIYGDWEFARRFFFRGQLQYLYINQVESYGGALTDDRLAIDWFPFLNYGFGVMYHYVGLRITKTFSNSDELTFKYYLGGPAIYFTAAF